MTCLEDAGAGPPHVLGEDGAFLIGVVESCVSYADGGMSLEERELPLEVRGVHRVVVEQNRDVRRRAEVKTAREVAVETDVLL